MWFGCQIHIERWYLQSVHDKTSVLAETHSGPARPCFEFSATAPRCTVESHSDTMISTFLQLLPDELIPVLELLTDRQLNELLQELCKRPFIAVKGSVRATNRQGLAMLPRLIVCYAAVMPAAFRTRCRRQEQR